MPVKHNSAHQIPGTSYLEPIPEVRNCARAHGQRPDAAGQRSLPLSFPTARECDDSGSATSGRARRPSVAHGVRGGVAFVLRPASGCVACSVGGGPSGAGGRCRRGHPARKTPRCRPTRATRASRWRSSSAGAGGAGPAASWTLRARAAGCSAWAPATPPGAAPAMASPPITSST